MSRGAFLVVYGTVEGQSLKVAQFISNRLAASGWAVRLVDAAQCPLPDPGEFAGAVVMAPLHIARYPPSIIEFGARHCGALNRMPTAFVSVSLSAAGHDPKDREGLARCLAKLEAETGWRPQVVHHAAGAFRFSRYPLVTRWVMKYIAWRKGQPTNTSRDYELTDWSSLGEFVDRFAASAAAAT